MNQHASMNRIYRLIWSEVQSAWVPVAETSRGRGKSGRGRSGRARSMASLNGVAAAISLALSPLALTPLARAAPAPAHPGPAASAPCAAPVCGATVLSATSHPQGGKVVSGSASITQVGNTTDIRQSSTDVSIDWLSFSIGAQSSVDFIQPSISAVAVNRISGSNGSEILGHLNANGEVYLINPNGILFGKGSQVNVGGLVASTLSESSPAGSSQSFSGSSTASIVNQGTITAANGGYVALIGNRVSNEGVITAQLGTVALGSGSAVTLDFSGDRLVHLQVDQSTLNNLAENKQLIEADGGLVIMTAGAQRALLASVVNNSGIIEARTVENHGGTIELLGGMSAGAVNVSGTLDASAPEGGNGGFIETNAAHVEVANEAKVTTASSQGLTGSWLIDPEDFTVAPTGGDISGAALSGELATTSVTLESSAGSKAQSGSGNVNIDDTVTWSANTKLTLTAANNVNVNENITATGSTAALAIDPNTANGTQTASGTGTFNLRAGAALVLTGADESLSISTANYTLGTGAVINLANVSPNSTTALTIGGVSYTVINSLGAAGSTTGTDLQGIEGKLSGHYALGSNIDASTTATWNSNGASTPVYAGFAPIGTSATPFTGTLEGLGHTITNLNIDRPTMSDVGLIGRSSSAAVIRDVGLLGGSVSGAGYVGALVGQSGGVVSNSYATGSVAGTSYVVGGLVGQTSGTVSDSYATGSVAAAGNGVGGLVGQNNGSISDSYATGNTVGSNVEVGGLVGQNQATVIDTYATGSVKGVNDVGGLIGYNVGSHSAVNTSYAKGAVSGSGSSVGGFAGNNTGSVANSFWDVTTSGQSTPLTGATGLTTAQMQTATNFTGFTFTSTPDASGNNWVMVDSNGTLNNAGGAQGATFPMLASEYTTRIDNAHQLQLMAMNPAGTYYLDHNIDASTTGTGTDVWGSSGFVPIGSTSGTFTGTFDGLLHSVSNLTIDLPSTTNVGLFGIAGTGSVIEEVGLAGGSVSGASYVGALVGKSQGTVNEAYATGTVSGVSAVGGLLGQTSGTVSESYATGNVTGTGNGIGGLVGQNNGTITDSYASGSATGSNVEVGGLVGQNDATVSDSYALGSVKGVNDVGGLGGYNVGAHAAIGISYAAGKVSGSGGNVGGLVGVNTGNIAESYWDITTSGQSTPETGATGLTTTQMQTATNFAGFGFTNTPGASGNNWVMIDPNGSLNNSGGAQGAVLPMLASEYSTTINNAHQLQLMAMNLGATYILGQNINASATGSSTDVWGSAGFIPIGNSNIAFTGTLDGLAHTITRLTINSSNSDVGLVGFSVSASTIEGVGLAGGSVTGASYVGELVGKSQGTVSYSYATGTVTGKGNFVGGLMGFNSGKVIGSNASGGVSGGSYVGGLLGDSVGASGAGMLISNSYATGNVSGTGNYVGGLVGYNSSPLISNSHATGDVSGGGSDVGGLVGYNSATGAVNGSYAWGSVFGASYVGGLIGYSAGTLNSGYATGNVGGYSNVGGLVGRNGGTLSASYATGQVNVSIQSLDLVEDSRSNPFLLEGVNGGGNAGGLVGINSGTVSGSYATGTVNGLYDLGGLVGMSSGMISNSQAAGNVSTIANYSNYDGYDLGPYATATGGLVGYNKQGTINTSHATGNVTGNTNVGGLVGNSSGSVITDYATGSVTGSGGVGGLVGAGGTISASYATGSVSGGGYSNVGGLAGDGAVISTSYATGNVSGGSNVGGLAGSANGITSSHATGSVIGTGDSVGGLVGSNTGPISGSYATGKVTGVDGVGDLAGYDDGAITNSYATGNVSGANDVGGLLGSLQGGAMSESYATGTVSGASYVGGLVGLNKYPATISTSHATGSVTGTGNDVGGLVGQNSGEALSSSSATGSVAGASYVGGLVGYNVGVSGSNPVVSTSYATGGVNGTGNYVGGLVGYNAIGAAVNSSYATGKVTGGGYSGGLVGYNSGTVSTSYAAGNVTGTKNVGGLVGDNVDSVANAYATGGVSGSSNIGGLVGINTGAVSTSYSTGSASGSSEVGGLVGNTAGLGTVSASFWNVTTSGLTTSAGGIGLTTAEMQTQTTFTSAGWNFTSIWYMPSGSYPLLQASMPSP
jgi:filamentous hemagglutinin family protein